jgi:hypothetical protein
VIIAGAIAITTRTNVSLQTFTGMWFFGSMLVFGVTTSILARFKTQSSDRGILVCYFVATSSVTARRRDRREREHVVLAQTLCGAVSARAIAKHLRRIYQSLRD